MPEETAPEMPTPPEPVSPVYQPVADAPEPDPAPEPVTPPKHGHIGRVLLVMLILIIVAAAAVGAYFVGKTSTPGAPAAVESKTSVSPAPATAVASETLSADVSFGYTTSPGQTIKPVPATVALTVPTSWRGQLSNAGDCTPNGEVNVNVCGAFNFVDALGTPTSLNATNSVTIYDLSDWLNANTATDSDRMGSFAGKTTSASKKAAFNAVTGLKPTSSITAKMVEDTLLNPFLTNAAFVGKSNLAYVQSADGTFKGYSYISTLSQDYDYAPSTYVVLAGNVKGASAVIAGEFKLNDAQRIAFGKLNPESKEFDAFAKSYNDGYAYAKDTLAQNSQVLAALKTLTVRAK